MPVSRIDPDASVGALRGEAVVCIPLYGAREHFIGCLQSVLAHTPEQVRILICDDASPDLSAEEFLRQLQDSATTDHHVSYLRRELNLGFPANVNGAFAITDPADVVIVNSDCVVAEGWLEGLRDAAYVDSRVATATALTNHGSVVSVPERRPLPELPPPWGVDEAAGAIRSRSLRLRPRLPTAVGHCVYVRRSALELVGEFDTAFTPGYGEEVDFSQRCLRRGLAHVLADDVLVLHHGGGSFASNGAPSPVQEQHERIIAARYPYYHDGVKLVEEEVTGPLARALGVARRALKGLTVAIDARVLDGPMTGTQLHVLELIAALSRTGNVRITAIVPGHLDGQLAAALNELPGVALLTRRQARKAGRADLVHRPYQISNAEDLRFLARLGERLVVTNQDLIGYHNPSYFRTFADWEGYRQITRAALAIADHVLFFSEHAQEDALAEDLVEPGRATVVRIGVDHSFELGQEARMPNGASKLPADAEAILCIGTDFRHKNRIFALRMLEQLQRRHGFSGYLLLAGPRVRMGSSRTEEAEHLATLPDVGRSVLDLGPVSEAEKAWLFDRARLVLYPSVHEGFGLVPFEAADRGVPCMWAQGTSLSEILPDGAAGMIPWDAAESADHALTLLRDDDARQRNLAAIRDAAAGLTWEEAGRRLLQLYTGTCDAPATPASAIERRYGLMQSALSEDALRLVGPGGALPSDVERPLLALATHPQVGGPMFRAIKLGYRASFRLRRIRGIAAGGDGPPRPPRRPDP